MITKQIYPENWSEIEDLISKMGFNLKGLENHPSLAPFGAYGSKGIEALALLDFDPLFLYSVYPEKSVASQMLISKMISDLSNSSGASSRSPYLLSFVENSYLLDFGFKSLTRPVEKKIVKQYSLLGEPSDFIYLDLRKVGNSGKVYSNRP